MLQGLKALGVAVSMDDFGTGYSSLSYLRKFPFDKVKIDRSFVGGLGVDPSAATIVRAAIALAARSASARWPKGIETEEQMAFLAEAGCAEAQGYLISRPLPAHEARRLSLRPRARERPLAAVAIASLALRHVTAEQTACVRRGGGGASGEAQRHLLSCRQPPAPAPRTAPAPRGVRSALPSN